MVQSIQSLENSLNENKDLSKQELIYYLYYHSKNDKLKDYNESYIINYFRKINYSFVYENIFVNKSNYTKVIIYIIGLLIPFYYNYPRFYKLGTVGFIIGIISYFSLISFINKTFGIFFPNIIKYFIVLNVFIYLTFFVLLNKLNHISLFFVSAIISYLLLSYIYRIKITLPLKNNIYNKFNAEFVTNNSATPFNENIMKACNQAIDKFGLKLPSGHMLYSYLTVFKIGNNTKFIQWTDFITNIISPIITVVYISTLGFLLKKSTETDSNSNMKIDLFPLIGLNENSFKYITCQANYVLPIEYNYSLFLHEYYTEKELDDKTYGYLVKALKRTSYELLRKYNPRFIKLENINSNDINKISNNRPTNNKIHQKEIAEHLNNNHIINRIKTFLNKHKIKFDPTYYIDDILDLIYNKEVSFEDKENAFRLFESVNNTLKVENEIDESYEDDVLLARNELLYNKHIDEEYKPLLKKLIDNYIEYFKSNIKENKLYGYDYNIVTYNIFNRKTRLYFNNIFKNIMKYFSIWLTFGKPITSGWLLATFIKFPGVSKFVSYFNSKNYYSYFWKYMTMGYDYSYMTDMDNQINKNNNNIIGIIGNTISKILLYIFICSPILNLYNNTFFGLTFSPLYYNFIIQILFILNLTLNFSATSLGYNTRSEIITLNILFFLGIIVVSIIVFIVYLIINYFRKK